MSLTSIESSFNKLSNDVQLMSYNSLHGLLASVCISQVGDKDDIMVFVWVRVFDPTGNGGCDQKFVPRPGCSLETGRASLYGSNRLKVYKMAPDKSLVCSTHSLICSDMACKHDKSLNRYQMIPLASSKLLLSVPRRTEGMRSPRGFMEFSGL